MDLILASSSRYRRELLGRLGLAFRWVDPGVDEDAVKQSGLGPIDLAQTLAKLKAEAVGVREPDAVVIGSDQLVVCEGQVLGKPITALRAVDQLLALSNREHQLITGVAITDRSGTETAVDISTLYVRHLSRAEAERYVDADQPLECAGSYKIESRGIALFDRIETNDHTAIIGLPLLMVCRLLRRRGFEIP